MPIRRRRRGGRVRRFRFARRAVGMVPYSRTRGAGTVADGVQYTNPMRQTGTHTIKRRWLFPSGAIIQNGATVSYNAENFQLSNLPSYSEFTTLFDMYRLAKVKITFYPAFNVAAATDNAVPNRNPGIGRIYMVTDFNDSTPPTTVDSLLEYDKCKVRYLAKPVVHTVMWPRVASTIFQTGMTAAYGTGKPMWINSAYPSVPHYGFKWAIQVNADTWSSDAQEPVIYDILYEYTVNFKNVN